MPEDIGTIMYLILFCSLAPISLLSIGLVMRWFINPTGDLREAAQVDAIWQHRDAWGEELCRRLIAGEIEPTMTPDMVRLAWDEPQSVSQEDDDNETWHYSPSADCVVRFREGQVTEVVGSRQPKQPKLSLRLIWFILGGLLVVIFTIIFAVLGIYHQ